MQKKGEGGREEGRKGGEDKEKDVSVRVPGRPLASVSLCAYPSCNRTLSNNPWRRGNINRRQRCRSIFFFLVYHPHGCCHTMAMMRWYNFFFCRELSCSSKERPPQKRAALFNWVLPKLLFLFCYFLSVGMLGLRGLKGRQLDEWECRHHCKQ